MNRQELTRQAIEISLSWLRVFIAAILAQVLAGQSDWTILLNAGLAAVIPPILRFLDVNDPAYGRGVPGE